MPTYDKKTELTFWSIILKLDALYTHVFSKSIYTYILYANKHTYIYKVI